MYLNRIILFYTQHCHLNSMIWPVPTESGKLLLSCLQVSAPSVWHTPGVYDRSEALNWLDLHRMKCFTCKNNNNPARSMVRFSCQKINRVHTCFLQWLLRHSRGRRTLEFQACAVGIKMFPGALRYAAVIGPEEDTGWKIVQWVKLIDWQPASTERLVYKPTGPIKLHTYPLYLFKLFICEASIETSCQSQSSIFIIWRE